MTTLIRLASPEDGFDLATIYAPAVRNRATSFELEPPNGREMTRRVNRTLERTPWLVCVHDGARIGYAYATAHRERAAYQWSVDVSAYVHPGSHRKGVGRGLYTSLFAALALQGFRNAYAGVTLPNPASITLHESVGFNFIGVYQRIGYKLGSWHDVAWYERQLAEYSSEPDPPVPLPAIHSEPCLAAAFATALGAGLPLIRMDS